jgi:hypothetical protein
LNFATRLRRVALSQSHYTGGFPRIGFDGLNAENLLSGLSTHILQSIAAATLGSSWSGDTQALAGSAGSVMKTLIPGE